jgi:hypothetical protein
MSEPTRLATPDELLKALGAVVDALRPLPPEARFKVVTAACILLGIKPPAA